jgi:hypothetical protein
VKIREKYLSPVQHFHAIINKNYQGHSDDPFKLHHTATKSKKMVIQPS